MDEYEKKQLLYFLKWSPLILLSLPFQLIMIIMILIAYGIPFIIIYIIKRIVWLRDDLPWYISRDEPLKIMGYEW